MGVAIRKPQSESWVRRVTQHVGSGTEVVVTGAAMLHDDALGWLSPTLEYSTSTSVWCPAYARLFYIVGGFALARFHRHSLS